MTESLFWILVMPIVQTGFAPVDVTSATLSCGSSGFLVSDTAPLDSVCAKPCLARAGRSSTTTPWRT